jgi:hypothetical protein
VTLSDATAYVNDMPARISEAYRCSIYAFLMKAETVSEQQWPLYYPLVVVVPAIWRGISKGLADFRLGGYCCSENDMSMGGALMPQVRVSRGSPGLQAGESRDA